MVERSTKINLAIFIAKKRDGGSSKLSEYERYRAALGNIEPTSINWHPVLICRSRRPKVAVVEAYDEIQLFSNDKNQFERFREHISGIVRVMTKRPDNVQVAICAHWGQVDYNLSEGSEWQKRLSFVRAALPKNWQFVLLSGSCEKDRDFICGEGPIMIPDEDKFDLWFEARL